MGFIAEGYEAFRLGYVFSGVGVDNLNVEFYLRDGSSVTEALSDFKSEGKERAGYLLGGIHRRIVEGGFCKAEVCVSSASD